MKTHSLSPAWLFGLALGFAAAVNLLVLSSSGFNVARAVLGAIWLFILPGWMISRLLALRLVAWWEKLSYFVGFGILAVIIWGLLINTLGPLAGNPHPFALPGMLFAMDVGWLALLAATWRRNHGAPFQIKIHRIGSRGLIVALSGAPLVILAVLGAISLNNSSTGAITWTMLALAAIYLGVLVFSRERLPEMAICWGLYWVSLSVLLMTSLRGWYITGHDVQLEYYVFSLTLSHLRWSIDLFRDAYNACLSITILPTVVHQIMGVSALYVYKTVFQIIFAVVPVQVYLIARRFSGRLVALLASIYFVAFPTFFQDMPMLNRQEIAFLFMGLIFLTAFNYGWSLITRRLVIFTLGIGVVLSHYTTAYFMLALFGMVVILSFVGSRYKRMRLTRLRSATKSDWRGLRQTGPISLALVLTLVAGTYLWSVRLTDTGGNLTSLVGQTFESVVHGFSGGKSTDTSYSLFGGSNISDQQRLTDYATATVATLRASTPLGQAYPQATIAAISPQVIPLANMPLTTAGKLLNELMSVVRFNSALRAGSAVFLQLALLIGVAVLFLARPLRRRLEGDWRLLQLAAVIFVGAVAVIPVLSAQYGVLRAFQQILMICAASIVLLTIMVIPKRYVRARTLVPSTLAIGFFVSSTGIITTALGGYPAQLQLANAGAYYDLYYTHDPETQAASWLASTISHSNQLAPVSSSVVSDGYLFDQINQLPGAEVSSLGIYPGILPQEGYVFLGYTAAVKHEAVIYDDGNLITYSYPTNFLNAHKDLIYTNSESEVYR